MSEAFGIMDSAYFVNKNDILKWVNTLLKLNIEKIDHLGTGAVYCQLLDMIYPGSICMSKVNWKAKLEYECLSNFKIVSTCLEKNDVKKHVDVNKIVKCKYQDNLEFAQWFKKFFDLKGGDRNTDYDPEARRGVKISTVVQEPSKAVRKEQQSVQRSTVASSENSIQVNADSNVKAKPVATTAPKTVEKIASTVSSSAHPSALVNKTNTQNLTLKKPTAHVPTNPNKRTLSQMYGVQSSKVGNLSTPSTKTAATSATSVKQVVNNQSKDYNMLVNSIATILSSGQNEKEIVSKIRQLFSDKENSAQKENLNMETEVKEVQPLKDTTNMAMEAESA